MKTRSFSMMVLTMLFCVMGISCTNALLGGSDSDDPLVAMESLADEAESDADNWSKSEMKEKFERSVDILRNFADKKKDYKKDEYRTLTKNLKRFLKAIDKTDVSRELQSDGYYTDMRDEVSEVAKELVDYFGKVDF